MVMVTTDPRSKKNCQIFVLFLVLIFSHCLIAKNSVKSAGAQQTKERSFVQAGYKNFKKPDAAELKKALSPLQFDVTQKDGTERAFKNEYWDNHEEGLYVDIVSGEPLFSSKDKFDSGTGWPSFTQPLSKDLIAEKTDRKLWSVRTEVRSKIADSHLGHVFDDGPKPTGKRYCLNSAALRFIPVHELEAKGYGEFKSLFTAPAKTETAILAGGCFWGVEELLRSQTGVIETEVGYTGGNISKPTYEQVKTGKTGHAEAIRIEYDPKKTSFETILKFFFAIHDPTTLNAQGNDHGSQYRSAIYYLSPEQKLTAEKVIAKVNLSKQWVKPVVTEVTPATEFFAAEFYHQNYLEKNPKGYTCHFNRKFVFD